jgi:hypothetical protein
MTLEDLPDGARVFVDANILIYHFSGISVECRAFLQRCESKQVDAFTGVHILLEVTHRLMVLEALHKGLIRGQPVPHLIQLQADGLPCGPWLPRVLCGKGSDPVEHGLGREPEEERDAVHGDATQIPKHRMGLLRERLATGVVRVN